MTIENILRFLEPGLTKFQVENRYKKSELVNIICSRKDSKNAKYYKIKAYQIPIVLPSIKTYCLCTKKTFGNI